MEYLDAVVTASYRPIYNASPEAVKNWLQEHKDDPVLKDCLVIPGTTLVPTDIDIYLND